MVDGAFLVACCDPSCLLEPSDQTLGAVAQAIGETVEEGLPRLVFFRRDHWLDVASAQAGTCGGAAVAFVPGHSAWAKARSTASRTVDHPLIQHRFERDLLMPLAAGQPDCDRPPMALGAPMHRGSKSRPGCAPALREPVPHWRRRRPGARRQHADEHARSSPPRSARSPSIASPASACRPHSTRWQIPARRQR